MKKTILTMAMLILVFIFSSTNNSGLAGEVYAWDDCPKGMVNDEYPGSCPRYIDTDENGICDHSEPAPKDRVENQKQLSDPTMPAKNESQEVTSNGVVFLSILIPLIIILGYAGFYKIKQKKTS
ncbi:hypothetical protein ISS86_01780 [Candidatus Microgenomates bacterium]|nr:hypothetical protein [Candidatus Microgenomates bacterium]